MASTSQRASARSASEAAGSPTRGEGTRERLLDAAEQLFAERGFEGASMRALTQAAGVNVSAANYHFGSKEALLRATLLRHLEPINRRRLQNLETLERGAAGRPLALEAIIEAFLRPLFEERAASADATNRFRRIAARLYSEPPEIVDPMKRDLFGPVAIRFVEALSKSLPNKPRREVALGFQLGLGVMVHVISGHLVTIPEPGDIGSEVEDASISDESLLEQMIAYMAAGLRARAPQRGLRT